MEQMTKRNLKLQMPYIGIRVSGSEEVKQLGGAAARFEGYSIAGISKVLSTQLKKVGVQSIVTIQDVGKLPMRKRLEGVLINTRRNLCGILVTNKAIVPKNLEDLIDGFKWLKSEAPGVAIIGEWTAEILYQGTSIRVEKRARVYLEELDQLLLDVGRYKPTEKQYHATRPKELFMIIQELVAEFPDLALGIISNYWSDILAFQWRLDSTPFRLSLASHVTRATDKRYLDQLLFRKPETD